MKKILTLLFLHLVYTTLYSTPAMTINKPGVYKIGNNVSFNAAVSGAGPIILINSSDVTLDLASLVVSQADVTANIDGIAINAGWNNITIQNGTIRGVTRYGINIDGSMGALKNIQLLNLNIETCAIRGIYCNNVSQSLIDTCNIRQCSATGAADNTLFLNTCTDITINNCTLIGNGIPATVTLVPINLTTCNQCNVTNSIIDSSTANSLVPIGLGGSAKNIVQNCIVRNNSATGTQNSISIDATSNFNVIQGCLVEKNTMANGAGISLANTSTNNTIIDCAVQNNSATTTTYNAFVANADNNQIIRCIASYNVSTTAACSGILVNANLCTIESCILQNNNGVNAANSFGIQYIAGTDDVFIKNIASYNGGTTASRANQLFGVSVGDRQLTALGGINGNCTVPWTNIGIAPNA